MRPCSEPTPARADLASTHIVVSVREFATQPGANKRFLGLVIALSLSTAGLCVVAGAAGASRTPSLPTKTAPLCAGKSKKAALRAIAHTWDVLLNGAAGRTLEERVKVIQGGNDSDFFQLLKDTLAANAQDAATTSARINSVDCTSRTAATVHYDVLVSGAPQTGLATPGYALIEGGRWKVSMRTVCDLVALADANVLLSGPCAV